MISWAAADNLWRRAGKRGVCCERGFCNIKVPFVYCDLIEISNQAVPQHHSAATRVCSAATMPSFDSMALLCR